MTCGIYAIVCDKTWRSYVGQTVNLETRYHDHCQKLRRKAHENSELQRDFDFYGESAFHYEILEYLEDEHLAGQREAYWIDFGENLYNKTNPNIKIELTEEEKIRFWKWVDIKGEDECWNWFGAKDDDGYGKIGFKRNTKKRVFRSNRVSYFISNPESDIHLVVRHTCNNPSCCNPNHLITGTFSQNKKDILDKEDHHYKLNWDLVNKIRVKFVENPNIKPLDLNKWAKENFDIELPRGYLVNVCMNENWIDFKYSPPNRTLKYYVTQSDRDLIKRYMNDGLTNTQIYKKVNYEHKIPISETSMNRTIQNIKKRGE